MGNEPYCAICREHVAPEESHVQIEAHHQRPRDRDERDDYLVHDDCWRSISEGWMKPA